MTRLLVVLLMTLALVPASNAAAMAVAPDCVTMQGGPILPDTHDDGCCTDECVMVPGAVALAASEAGAEPPGLVAPAHSATVPVALQPSNPAADDPPPRR